MSQKLLFITPKIDESHDDLAFAGLWAKAFNNADFDVQVICTRKGVCSLDIPVYSLGGERGVSRLGQFLNFQKLIMTLKYDRVFVHMTPRWLAAGSWFWWLRRIPHYLWFTHYTRTLALKIGDKTVKRMFAATKECLPHYDGDERKIVTGHGIDTDFWQTQELLSDEEREPITHLLCVHRISRSKRFDLVLKALALLPSEYKLTHYGQPQDPRIDPEYADEIKRLVIDLNLGGRVRFMGAVPMHELKKIYPRFQTFINMVPRTIDKTVLEAMYCGLTPIMTYGQAEAIGYPGWPSDDTPEAIAGYIKRMQLKSREQLQKIVNEGHSLKALIGKMAVYIRPGS
ncbi:MAG: glycosyltransferase family 4 protein [Patescibacteria group bacterium]